MPLDQTAADEFVPGSIEYNQAHGLYRTRRRKLVVVSPGAKPPRRATRLHSVAHPGILRERIARGDLDYLHRASLPLTTGGQGVDISEFQGVTPGGFSFYVVRYLNEYARTDSRIDQHVNSVRGMGRTLGSYGIIRPGAADPVAWANNYVNLLRRYPTNLVPVVDIELGNAAANRDYAAVVNNVLRSAGFPVLMGYYSAGSAFRQLCAFLYNRQWLAAWGSGYPAGADMHQHQGSPLDLDYCPNLEWVSGGITPGPVPEVDDLPFSYDQLVGAARQGAIDAVKLIIQGDQATINALLSYGTHSVQFINEPGYENSANALKYAINTTPVHVDGSGPTFGEVLTELLPPSVRKGAALLDPIKPDVDREKVVSDLVDPEAAARLAALTA